MAEEALNPFLRKNDLTKYNNRMKPWVTGKISDAISALGNILTIKGRVETKDALPTDPKAGDVYMVGAADAAECEEWLYTEEGKWEYVGVTSPSLEGYVTETSLYKGADGTGTTDAPADGTILASISSDVTTVTTDVDNIKTELAYTLSDEDLDAMFTS